MCDNVWADVCCIRYVEHFSDLYDITINDILEPKIQPQKITDFEQISTISEKELKEVLGQFDTNSLVTALMGASPETNCFCERLFPDIDFEMTRKNIGRIRIETVEDMQNQIVAMINLQAAVIPPPLAPMHKHFLNKFVEHGGSSEKSV